MCRLSSEEPFRGARDETQSSATSIRDGDVKRSTSLTASLFRNARTRGQFKPRNANKGTSSYQLRQFAEATLGSGSLRKAVKLPEGEDLSEWLAVNGMDWESGVMDHGNALIISPQSSISIIRSTFFMGQSQNSALHSRVLR